MSDRAALLAAIRARPAEDLPRLMYADYLDGQDAPTDRDRATAEFIRLSCDLRRTAQMPRAVYPWLLSAGSDGYVVENWKRLVPSVLALDRTPDGPVGTRRGRRVSTSLVLPVEGRLERYALAFEFHRGLLRSCVLYSPYAAAAVLAALYADQPLVALHMTGLTGHRAQGLYERLRTIAGPEAARLFLAEVSRW